MTSPTDPEAGEPVSGEQNRTAARESVMLSAIVERFGGGEPTKHRVRDLSAGGVRIDQAQSLKRGATVVISVGALQAIGATVVWVERGFAGLKFAQAINPDDARAKAAIAPRAASSRAADVRHAGPTAGWMPDLNNPYRK